MSKPQPSRSQYRRETRYFIQKYGRVAFFKANDLLNAEQSKLTNRSEHGTTKQAEEQLVTTCCFSYEDAQRFALMAPLQALYSQQNDRERRSVR